MFVLLQAQKYCSLLLHDILYSYFTVCAVAMFQQNLSGGTHPIPAIPQESRIKLVFRLSGGSAGKLLILPPPLPNRTLYSHYTPFKSFCETANIIGGVLNIL
jgi:hypothetical protein